MVRDLRFESAECNLGKILTAAKYTNPEAQLIVCGMLAPPNMGPEYETGFANIFTDLAKEFNAGFIPFFLQGVADVPGLALDGKHPTAEGQKIVRDNIWKVLEAYL